MVETNWFLYFTNFDRHIELFNIFLKNSSLEWINLCYDIEQKGKYLKEEDDESRST